MKSWYHDKFNDFQTLFAFNRILKHFSHTFVRGHGSWARCSKLPSISWICPHIGLNNVNIIFRLIILHYSKHLQFKFDLSKKTIQLNKMIIYSKRRNIPKLNMEYHGQYVDSRKKVGGQNQFFFETLCRVLHLRHTTNKQNTRQTFWVGVCPWHTTKEMAVARQLLGWHFCRVPCVRHTANMALLPCAACCRVLFLAAHDKYGAFVGDLCCRELFAMCCWFAVCFLDDTR